MGRRKAGSALTALSVKRLGPGMHADGSTQGLYLRVGDSGSRSWIFRYMLAGRRRDMGLGPADLVTLAQARDAATEARLKVWRRIDPLTERDATRTATEARRTVDSWTFEREAREVHSMLLPGWRNPKHGAQWISTLETYAFPLIGSRPVGSIDVAAIVDVLRPIWTGKEETARRVRQRLDAVMRSAHAHGRATTNPVDAAVELLPKQRGRDAVEHHAALPVKQTPGFWKKLTALDANSAPLALRFAIATAARSGEVRGARWSEIDLDAGLWTIPGTRMKAGREHQVPLSAAARKALALAAKLPGRTDDSLVFPGMKGKPLSDASLGAVLDRMGVEVTPHGFRSSFRDWCSENGVSREVAERALAHAVKDSTEAAYSRTQLVEQRRPVMDRWSAFLAGGAR